MASFRATESRPTTDAAVLTCIGRLDKNEALDAHLAPVLIDGIKRVVLDLAGVEYVSSAGLRSLLVGLKKTRLAGGELAVCGVTSSVRQVLELSGFPAILRVFPDRTSALAGLRSASP